jgi:hypothetical protein
MATEIQPTCMVRASAETSGLVQYWTDSDQVMTCNTTNDLVIFSPLDFLKRLIYLYIMYKAR